MYQSEITLKKISALSGFSVSTVSKALNDKHDISPNTKSTIQSIARKYNYVPNYSALSLRKQQTKSIAVLIPQINHEFYANLLSELQKLSFSYGYKLFVFQTFSLEKNEKVCFKLMSDGSVDGILVVSNSNNDCLIKRQSSKTNVPMVYIIQDDKNIEGDIERLASQYLKKLIFELA